MNRVNDYFLPYQRAWILDDSSMKFYEKSRRIGITYATSFRVNDKCLRRRNFTQWVTSRDELTAHEFITDYIAKWAKASNAVCRGLLGDDLQVIDPERGIRAFVATYEATGSRVVSLSSTPEAFAGKGGDVLIDEADLHKDSGRVIDMALPCTTWGGQLEVLSALSVDGGPNTPFCKMGRDILENGNPMGWSFHRTTIVDAVEQGFVEKLNEDDRRRGRTGVRRETQRGDRSALHPRRLARDDAGEMPDRRGMADAVHDSAVDRRRGAALV